MMIRTWSKAFFMLGPNTQHCQCRSQLHRQGHRPQLCKATRQHPDHTKTWTLIYTETFQEEEEEEEEEDSINGEIDWLEYIYDDDDDDDEYTTVPPFEEYRFAEIYVTRSATTVLHWCWYGPSTVVTPYNNGTKSVGPGKYIFRDYKIVAHISDTTKDYHDTSVIEWPTANHVAWDKNLNNFAQVSRTS